MVLDSTDANSVVLVAKELWMEQAADMNLFIVTEHSLVNMTHPKKGVKMEVKLKRKIMSEMMTTYLPSSKLVQGHFFGKTNDRTKFHRNRTKIRGTFPS